MRRIDIIASVALIGFAAVLAFVIIPFENAGGVWHGLSPYFYPMIMLAGIALASVGLFVQAVTKPSLYDDQPNPISLSQVGFFALVSVVILAGAILIDFVGFWIGGPILIAAVMLFMGLRNPLIIVPVAIGAVAVVSIIVSWGLKTPLP